MVVAGKVLWVGAATSVIFVTTKRLFCHDKSVLVLTKVLAWMFLFVATKLLSQQIFAATNIILSWFFVCGHDKHTFVMTKHLLSWQKYACHDKSFVMTNMCLSWQKVYHDYHNFVVTNILLLWQKKKCFVTTNTHLSWHRKVVVNVCWKVMRCMGVCVLGVGGGGCYCLRWMWVCVLGFRRSGFFLFFLYSCFYSSLC